MSEIAILIPLLGRPGSAQRVLASIRRASSAEHRVLFLCSPHDRRKFRECSALDAETLIVDWDAGPGDFARKMNYGFRCTDEPFIFAGADDLTFESGWDEHVLTVAEKSGAGVVGTWDGANPLVMRGRHATHPLVRRSYAESPTCTFDQSGPIYHEGYDHQFCDNELVQAARDRGEWAFAKHSRVLHRHPIFDRTVRMDGTYRKGLARGREDADLFRERLREWRRTKSLAPA